VEWSWRHGDDVIRSGVVELCRVGMEWLSLDGGVQSCAQKENRKVENPVRASRVVLEARRPLHSIRPVPYIYGTSGPNYYVIVRAPTPTLRAHPDWWERASGVFRVAAAALALAFACK
jgi:hypothetical protein